MGTGPDAVPAPDALCMVRCAGYIDIHFADFAASTAGGAFVRVNVELVQGDSVEQCIKGSQRTDPLAERAIEEHGKHHDAEENTAFPCEQLPQTGPDARIGNGKRNAALQNAGRADVFAEKRIAQTHFIHHGHRKDNYEDNQNDILETGEEVQLFCAEFSGGDFVQQFLEPSERAEETAHHPSEQYSNENQEPGDIIGKMKLGGPDDRLQGTNGAGGCRCGTGVAVQAGDTDDLGTALVDFSPEKVQKERVGSESGSQLEFPAAVVFSQCPHTPDTD